MSEVSSLEESASGPADRVWIHDAESDAPVSRQVLDLFFQVTGIPRTPLFLRHTLELPQGCGFGTSGAGALSLALALNRLYGDPLTHQEAGVLAHKAEIRCKTGLGTVLAEFHGGFLERTYPGAPGIGQVTAHPLPPEVVGIFLVYGPLSTAELLDNQELKRRLALSGAAQTPASSGPLTVDHFLSRSGEFSQTLGLMTPRLEKARNRLQKLGFQFSMLMFGEGLFSLVPRSEAPEILSVLSSCGGESFLCPVDTQGARVL